MLLQPFDIPGNEEPRIMMILSIFSAYLSLSNRQSHKTFNMTLLFKMIFSEFILRQELDFGIRIS